MPIRLRCPTCSAGLSIASRKAGQTIKCPGCKSAIIVPGEGAGRSAATVAAVPQRASEVDEPDPDDEFDEEEGLSLRRPDSDFEGMDLTPMVDVTFLLLIFFMITASFSIQKTLAMPRPEPDQEGAAQTVQLQDIEQDSILVEVDENNGITVDDRAVDRGSLLGEIQRQMRENSKNELLMKVHYFASHESTVLVRDAAAEAGIQRVRFGVIPGTGPE